MSQALLADAMNRLSSKSIWPTVPLGAVLRHRKAFIVIDDLHTYKRCRVQLHAQGIVLRDELTGAEIKTKNQQVCRAGDFLVAEIDAKVGGFGIVPEELDSAIVSSHYFLFEIDTQALDKRFLDYYVRTSAFREQVYAQGSTNYAGIRPRDVPGYSMRLPPLTEQRQLVERIEALAAKIGEATLLREKAVKEANTLLHTIMDRCYEDHRATYAVVPLGSVCSSITDGATPYPVV